MDDSSLFCPCCTFNTNDLFLPPSERRKESIAASHKETQPFFSPLQSLEHLSTTPLVDTHGHAHLQRRRQEEEEPNNEYRSTRDNIVISLTCAVAPSDWMDCLHYAAQYPHRRAAIGVHPWYLNELLVIPNDVRPNTDDHDDSSTPLPQLRATWLSDMESLLQQHPGCLVGEIGLCQMARFVRTFSGGKLQALQLQRTVLEQQLQLATKYQRPVSIHCVQQQKVLLDVFRTFFTRDSVPPAMALHSFSGTAHQVQQLLQWERTLQRETPLLYFGFSHIINVAMCTSERAQRQTRLAILQVPYDRLLAESDVHREEDVAAGTAGAVAFLAFVLERPLLDVAEQTRENGLRFLSTLSGVA